MYETPEKGGHEQRAEIRGIPWASLERWGPVLTVLTGKDSGAKESKAKFPVHPVINSKVALWKGHVLELEVDAVVNTTNEHVNLKAECAALDGLRTGEAKITRGYELFAKRVIHTVGPKYNPKYKTAAEGALHNSYKQSMLLMREHKLRSVVFPCLYLEKKGYPRDTAAHIACRTLRRCLEHLSDHIDVVVLAMNEADHAIYEEVMPIYFPRDEEDEIAAEQVLPDNVGNEWGENVSEERQIRITTLTRHCEDDDDDDENENAGGSWVAEGDVRDAMPLTKDPDQRRKKSASQLAIEEAERVYHKYLKRARTENFDDIARLDFIYRSGNDQHGRPVIVVVCRHLPASTVDLERVMMYIIKVMDPVVEQDYTIVYFHTDSASANHPDYAWLRKFYSVFNRKYKKNMKAMYIVHPSMWVKLTLWFMTPFVSQKVWKKVLYMDSLHSLFEVFNPATLRIPPFVNAYDARVCGGVQASSSAGMPHSDL